MWPSTAHLRPVLSVTIGAITTVVFWPCATSRIRSWGGSQCADLDAEVDGGVDVGTLVRLGVGFDVTGCTRDVHDTLRQLKASNVAATANGLMLMGHEPAPVWSTEQAHSMLDIECACGGLCVTLSCAGGRAGLLLQRPATTSRRHMQGLVRPWGLNPGSPGHEGGVTAARDSE